MTDKRIERVERIENDAPEQRSLATTLAAAAVTGTAACFTAVIISALTCEGSETANVSPALSTESELKKLAGAEPTATVYMAAGSRSFAAFSTLACVYPVRGSGSLPGASPRRLPGPR